MTVATVVKSVGATARAFSTLDAWCDAAPANLTTAEKWTAGTFVGTFQQGETVTGTGLTAGKFLDSDGSSYVTFGIVTGNSATLVTLTGSTSGATCIVSTKTDTGIIWKGEAYNDAEFTGKITFPTTTTSATCYFWLKPASGQGFADHANKLTNALKYNRSNGVGSKNTAHGGSHMDINANYVTLEGMQFQHAGTGAVTYMLGGDISKLTVLGCVLEQLVLSLVSNPNYGSSLVFINCVIIHRHSTTGVFRAGLGSFYNCTILRSTDLTTNGNAFAVYYGSYPRVRNCLVIGAFTTMFANTLASYVSVTGYNASSVGTGSMPGSNNVGSLTASNELTGVTDAALDCRPKSGNSLAAGTRDAALTNDLDILGQARSTTTPTIGAMEYISAGAAASSVPRRSGARFNANFMM